MATREGVEKCDASKAMLPATVKQKKLIVDAEKDFPDMTDCDEYRRYTLTGNRQDAARLISRVLDEHMDDVEMDKENYVHYIAYRPRVEKVGRHGLFSVYNEPVVLNSVANEVAHHPGNVWTAIMSLRREDAQRLGYDNAASWQSLINANASLIAEQMHIELKDLKWYAAFHDESYHPHIHMVMYSADPKQGYLPPQGIDKIRSALAGQIFHDELHQIYEEQTSSRNDLAEAATAEFKNTLRQMSVGVTANSRIQKLMPILSNYLQKSKGKIVYGYLPKGAKAVVNQIVDALADDDKVATAYEKWYELRRAVLETYRDDAAIEPPPLSTQPEFKAIKNMIVKEAWSAICHPENDEEQTAFIIDDPVELELDESSDEDAFVDWNDAFVRAHKLLYEKLPDELALSQAVASLNAEASRGNAYAMYDMAQYYERGLGVEKNDEIASLWYSKALRGFLSLESTARKPGVNFRIGKMYMLGKGTAENDDNARKFFILAAENDHDAAMYNLGKLEVKSATDAESAEPALNWFLLAARKGNTWARYALGKMYADGVFVDRNMFTAARYLRDAVADGNDMAAYKLATIFLDKDENFYNVTTAIQLLEQSVAKDNPLAKYRLGKILLLGDECQQDVPRALALLTEAADKQHNMYAQYLLGKAYLYGNPVEQDIALGNSYLSASAAQGNAYAQYLLDHQANRQIANAVMGATRLMQQVEKLFAGNEPHPAKNNYGGIDRKRLRILRKKKLAQGHAEDDMDITL